MRIGVDWGGTKLEVIALGDDGETLLRERVATPQDDYQACVQSVYDLVQMAEEKTGMQGSVGIGIPGTISPATGLVKNANSTWLNGQSLLDDLQSLLGREIRIQNDANCFAVSEATDGAGQGKHVVIGVIIGTGCGCGIAIDGKALAGRQGIAGEFGHTALSPMLETEFPGNSCWCGKRGCLETYISGTGFKRTYESKIGEARGLSQLVNILDPDIIVLGGGMSNVKSLYSDVPNLMKDYVFTDQFDTSIVCAKHGDSSGVRGAAWLW